MFRLIPGLQNAEFARLGGLHRNTFLNSPRLLDATLRLKARPCLRFAGQITGCEGYVESAAIGLIAGRFAAAERLGQAPAPPPPTTAIGALLNHITGGHIESIDAGPRSFQPMNVNFGLFPPIAEPREDEKRQAPSRPRKRRGEEAAAVGKGGGGSFRLDRGQRPCAGADEGETGGGVKARNICLRRRRSRAGAVNGGAGPTSRCPDPELSCVNPKEGVNRAFAMCSHS